MMCDEQLIMYLCVRQLAFEREVAFWETAIYKAAKEYFPHVRGSDWLYTKWTPDYCVPDPDGWMSCRVRA